MLNAHLSEPHPWKECWSCRREASKLGHPLNSFKQQLPINTGQKISNMLKEVSFHHDVAVTSIDIVPSKISTASLCRHRFQPVAWIACRRRIFNVHLNSEQFVSNYLSALLRQWSSNFLCLIGTIETAFSQDNWAANRTGCYWYSTKFIIKWPNAHTQQHFCMTDYIDSDVRSTCT